LKKQSDEAVSKGLKFEDAFNIKQLSISLMIAFIVGSVTGVIGMIQLYDNQLVVSKELVISIITIGYAGTDFIEGFIKSRVTT
jgi:hypothetical protein